MADTAPPEWEYVLDGLVDHRRTAGAELFRVRWHGYGPDQDTWEPILHLPRNRVVRYCHRRRIPVPPNLADAQLG